MSELSMTYIVGQFIVGLSGHRVIRDAAAVAHLKQVASTYFAEWSQHYPSLIVLTQLAAGADTELARIALSFGAQIIVVVPWANYEAEFHGADLVTFQQLRTGAARVIQLTDDPRSDEVQLRAGRWIVDHSYATLAAWDEKPSRNAGSIADVVEYANTHPRKKPVFIIHTDRS